MNKAILREYEHGVAIFGALDFYDGTFDGELGVIRMITTCAENAAFFGWHKGVADAMRTACHLIYVDPMLVEAYIGCRFEDVVDEITSIVDARTIRAKV